VSAQAPPSSLVERVIAFADDELVVGWRDSEWTGVAPFLEEDVAFSSIAQGEIGHARALYELVVGGDADALAFDRRPDEYRSAPLVELPLAGDWAGTVARHWLYETADAIRLADLMRSEWPELAGLAAKMDREEAYHRMHAQMWRDKLRGEERFETAVARLWPYALGVLEPSQRARLAETVGREEVGSVERGSHDEEFAALHDEMTMVRRSVPGARW
jgi:ring-1,2-phenylacetyl-CoA epoxidase subunit PaaC